MIRDLGLKVIAIAVIAFAGMTSPLSAGLGPEEPCGPENYGETFCEGCDVCYSQAPHYRMSQWTCTATHGWDEYYSGYDNHDDCDFERIMCEPTLN